MKVVLNWLDNNSVTRESQDKIDWARVIPFIGIHVGCIGVLWVGHSYFAIMLALAFYGIRIFSIGAFYHRYFSHKSYETNRFWQFIFALLGMSAIQRGPLWWAAHHRHHHIHSDDPDDSHSAAQHGFWWSHIGWFLSKRHFHYPENCIKDFSRYPEIKWLDRFDSLIAMLFAGTIFLIGYVCQSIWPALNTSGLQCFIWVFCISTVCSYHVTFCINSLTHIFGKRVYPTKDQSKNHWLLALLTFGEGWHNNHHFYPVSARQGFTWWQIDITYYILKGMEKIRIIKNLKKPPQRIIEQAYS